MCHVEEGEEKGRVSVEACHAGVQGMGGGAAACVRLLRLSILNGVHYLGRPSHPVN